MSVCACVCTALCACVWKRDRSFICLSCMNFKDVWMWCVHKVCTSERSCAPSGTFQFVLGVWLSFPDIDRMDNSEQSFHANEGGKPWKCLEPAFCPLTSRKGISLFQKDIWLYVGLWRCRFGLSFQFFYTTWCSNFSIQAHKGLNRW